MARMTGADTQTVVPPTDFDQTKRMQRCQWSVDGNCVIDCVIATPQAGGFADNSLHKNNLHLHNSCNDDNYSSPRLVSTKPSAFNVSHLPAG